MLVLREQKMVLSQLSEGVDSAKGGNFPNFFLILFVPFPKPNVCANFEFSQRHGTQERWTQKALNF